jgi:hypothetical protein
MHRRVVFFILFILPVLIISFVCISCTASNRPQEANVYTVDSTITEAKEQITENNKDREELLLLSPYTRYREVINNFGEPDADVGLNFVIVEYQLSDGRRVTLHFGRGDRLYALSELSIQGERKLIFETATGYGVDPILCVQTAFDVAEALGFNTYALYAGMNRDILRTNDVARNLANAALDDIIREITGEQAQSLTNSGYLVIATMETIDEAGSHLATVRQSDTPYDSSEGPLLDNVGPVGIASTVTAFGRENYNNNRVKFYYDPEQKLILNLNWRNFQRIYLPNLALRG